MNMFFSVVNHSFQPTSWSCDSTNPTAELRQLPSGNLLHMENHHAIHGKTHEISMAIFQVCELLVITRG